MGQSAILPGVWDIPNTQRTASHLLCAHLYIHAFPTFRRPYAAGKTKCINHFLINDCWYMVDLPGYGYAKVGVDGRQAFDRFTREYLTQRYGRGRVVEATILLGPSCLSTPPVYGVSDPVSPRQPA